MTRFLHHLCLLFLLLTVGTGAAWAEKKTYRHVFTTKPDLGAAVSLSGVSWSIEATALHTYNSGNYAGVQIGSSSVSGSFTMTSPAWNYQSATTVTEVRLWLNTGGQAVTPSVTIGGRTTTAKGSIVKNSTIGTDWTKASLVTFTPASGGAQGAVVINIATTRAGYFCALEVDCETDDGDTGGSGSDGGGQTGGSGGSDDSGTGATTDGFVAVPRVTVGLDRAQVDVCRYLNFPAGYRLNTYDIRTSINSRSQKDREYACVYRWLTFLKPGRYTVHVRAVGADQGDDCEGDVVFDVVDPDGAPAADRLEVSDVTLYVDALRRGLRGFRLDVLQGMLRQILNTLR